MRSLLRFAGIFSLAWVEVAAGAEPNAATWGDILRARVNRAGEVAYRSLATEDEAALARHVSSLADAKVEGLPSDEAVAFWLNAYHAVLLSAVVQGERPETVEGRARLYHWFQATVAGAKRTLDDIQAALAPYAARDPRIHLALSNGTRGGPRLVRRPYEADRLDTQLAAAARAFANDGRKNRFDPVEKRIRLSRIFAWHRRDFARPAGSLEAFLEPLLRTPAAKALLAEKAEIRYLKFDWRLAVAKGEEPPP